MSDRWRGVVAALVNPDLRRVLADSFTGDELSPGRRERAAARLRDIGLLRQSSDGDVFDEDFVRSILSDNPRPRRTGPERFLDGAGRIDRYPVQHPDLIELLNWVASRAILPGQVYVERELNERLAPFTDDVAALRRHLVDAEILERTRSGSQYALVTSAD